MLEVRIPAGVTTSVAARPARCVRGTGDVVDNRASCWGTDRVSAGPTTEASTTTRPGDTSVTLADRAQTAALHVAGTLSPGPPTGCLILLRHGQSVFNLENRFTGLADPPLAEAGMADAQRAGEHLRGLRIDAAYASQLRRAQDTAHIALQAAHRDHLPLIAAAALNDRDYGTLEGRNRDDLTREFGAAQVEKWRHDYFERPPNGQSIDDIAQNVIPFYEQTIVPRLRAGENVLLTGHCDSLAALIMHIEHVQAQNAPYVPNGQPIVFRFDDQMAVTSKQTLT